MPTGESRSGGRRDAVARLHDSRLCIVGIAAVEFAIVEVEPVASREKRQFALEIGPRRDVKEIEPAATAAAGTSPAASAAGRNRRRAASRRAPGTRSPGRARRANRRNHRQDIGDENAVERGRGRREPLDRKHVASAAAIPTRAASPAAADRCRGARQHRRRYVEAVDGRAAGIGARRHWTRLRPVPQPISSTAPPGRRRSCAIITSRPSR